jgi:hypothetical protein
LKGHQYSAEIYRARNKRVMRFWTLLGPTTNRTLLVVAGLMNNLWIFVWPVLIVGNVLLVVAVLWQRHVWHQLDKAPETEKLRAA